MRIATALVGVLLLSAPARAQTPPAQTPPAGAQAPAPAPAAPAGTKPKPAAGTQPQRRATPAGNATLAIAVTDPAGAPIGDVKVTLLALDAKTPTPGRESRTERAGRIAFENVPSGNYRLRFDRDGFIPLERELTARPGPPIDVKVTLAPAPAPPAPPPAPAPAPAPPPAPALSPDPIAIDMTAFIEKNYIGRSENKVLPLTCTTGGPALLLQVREGLADPARPDADEFLYVIAGEGIGRAGGHDQPLRPGTFMMVPRGVPRILAASGRTPLVLLSVRAGEKCSR
jgi:5-hydroxyisourate hydrolase-like protein (transthyretin family)